MVYVTPCHSIENLYCESSAVRRLVRSESGLAKAKLEKFDEDEILDCVIDIYNKTHHEFLKSSIIKRTNALLYLFSKGNLKSKLNLNSNLSLETKFLLEHGKILAKHKIFAKGNLQQIIHENARGKILSHRAAIKSSYRTTICRGKQDMEFLQSFIHSCAHGAINSYIKEKFGFVLRFGSGGTTSDVLSFAAQYARKPDCLIRFLWAANDEVEKALKAA
ncbi:DUF4435 domain-containing protein [Burkholderia ubonensis]|uniref:DUF4435 domain-containing protein n=1 Tax=Burkholderia ubonensis TaxID=101571 RepID=UPI0039F63984